MIKKTLAENKAPREIQIVKSKCANYWDIYVIRMDGTPQFQKKFGAYETKLANQFAHDLGEELSIPVRK